MNIIIFTESNIFKKNKIEESVYLCKISKNKNNKFENICINLNGPECLLFENLDDMEKDLFSLLKSLYFIKENFQEDFKKIIIKSKYINNTHYKLLFDTWEYRNFRGVPYFKYWKEIHKLLIEFLHNDIELKFS